MEKRKKMPEVIQKILKNAKPPKEYERIYYKPKQWKLVLGFIVCILFLISLIFVTGFKLDQYFIILFVGDLLVGTFFGINLFTKKGFLLPKMVEKKQEQSEEVEESEEDEEVDEDESWEDEEE